MKLKKKYSYKNKNQIWRLHITDSDKLLLETRETETERREVFFNLIDIHSGKTIFADVQFEEKSWIGVEAIYKDVLFLHHFAKPDMPGHKKIFAYDLAGQKLLWQNDEFVFQLVCDDKLYAAFPSMTGIKYIALNYRTGERVDEKILSEEEMNKIAAESEKDYSPYKFPETYHPLYDIDESVKSIIEEQTRNYEIVGNVEFIDFPDALTMNFHFKKSNGKLKNLFLTIDKKKNKVILKETLNDDVNAYAPDSFFVYKNLLLLLKNRNETAVKEIIGS
ncbi:MAG: DUF4905 domain-containing protein [Chlorobi bacterium]|nr:DUF4905 domain-containing protein [Chlorobiota bacterium]